MSAHADVPVDPEVLADPKAPSLEVEHELFEEGARLVIGMDEVGRGAIAGPVAVGAHVIERGETSFPEGLRDSKLLSPKRREAMLPFVTDWGSGAVGYGAADEIDAHGITRMLGMAAVRALRDLQAEGIDVPGAVIVLDGAHDWLSPVWNDLRQRPLDVRTRVRADRECASVAAASVRAKVSRDRVMSEAHELVPHYAWDSNKGYGSRAHYAGIEAQGTSALHRLTWIHPSTTNR